MAAKRFRAYGANGDLFASGDVVDGKAIFDIEELATQVVFYDGDLDDEHVVDSVIGVFTSANEVETTA